MIFHHSRILFFIIDLRDSRNKFTLHSKCLSLICNCLQLGRLRPGEVLEPKVRFVFAITQSLPARVPSPAKCFSICYLIFQSLSIFPTTFYTLFSILVFSFFTTAPLPHLRRYTAAYTKCNLTPLTK